MTPDVEFERGHRLKQVCVDGLTSWNHRLDALRPRIEGKGMTDEDVQVFGTSVCEIDGDLACAVIGVTDDQQAAQGPLATAKADGLVEDRPADASGPSRGPQLPPLTAE